MKAMILCAGKGTRLRPLTLATSKPMIPLVDKPVMQYIVEHLASEGVKDIAVNLSYMPEKIHDFFRTGEQLGVNMFYSYEGSMENGEFCGEAIGSGGGLKKIQEESNFFDDTFLVLCGDAAINLDVRRLVAEHKKRKALATIVLKPVEQDEVNKYGIVALQEDGRISEFQEKPNPSEAVSTLANTGIYIFEPEVLDYVPTGEEYDLGGDLFPLLAEKSDRLFGAVENFDWLDIGNISDFRAATRQMLVKPPVGLALPGKELASRVRVGANVKIDLSSVTIDGPVYIGPGSSIAPGARLVGPMVIGHNCEIGENAIIHQSILGDHVRVRENTLLTDAIVFGGQVINAEGRSAPLSATNAVGDTRTAVTELDKIDSAIVDLRNEPEKYCGDRDRRSASGASGHG